MKSTKITPPEGWEIDEEKSTFQEIVYKEIAKNIRERIHTLEDIFKLNNTTEKAFNKKWNKEVFTNNEIGIGLELLIVNAYNEGRENDWSDNTWKRYPYFYMQEYNFLLNCVGVHQGNSYAPSALCFNGSEAELNCRDAVKKFLPQYKQSRLG